MLNPAFQFPYRDKVRTGPLVHNNLLSKYEPNLFKKCSIFTVALLKNWVQSLAPVVELNKQRVFSILLPFYDCSSLTYLLRPIFHLLTFGSVYLT